MKGQKLVSILIPLSIIVVALSYVQNVGPFQVYPMFYIAGLLIIALTGIVWIGTLPRVTLHWPTLVPTSILLILAFWGSEMWAARLLAATLFLTYLTVSNVKPDWKSGLGVLVGVAVLSLVISNIDGDRSGGLMHNRNIAVGVLTIVTLLSMSRRQWLVSTIALVGLFSTGAEQALVVVAALSTMALLRRDLSRRTLLPLAVLSIVLVVSTPLGITEKLWQTVPQRVSAMIEAPNDTNVTEQLQLATGNRYVNTKKALGNIKWLGQGYEPLNIEPTSLHVLPVRILYELGPLGLLAWGWLIVWGLVKSQKKYLWVAIASISLVDHMFWTSLAPYFYIILGLSVVDTTKDYIFKEAK